MMIWDFYFDNYPCSLALAKNHYRTREKGRGATRESTGSILSQALPGNGVEGARQLETWGYITEYTEW
jgi:hypothetical protein